MPKNNRTKRGQKEQLRMAAAIDELAEFEDFKEKVLPKLREYIRQGLDADAIYKKCASMAAARGVTIAMTSKNENQALAAIKDILDRSQGKAVERKDVKHKFDGMKDEEIDALVLSRWGDMEDDGVSN